MPGGRPTDYTVELGDAICREIAGGATLTSIVKREGMPCMATVQNWRHEHPEFLEAYTRARLEQADVLADQIVDVADTELDAQIARVRVDARKWTAAKLRPARYGEAALLKLAGADGKGPIKSLNVNAELSDEEATAAYQDLLK